jgi:tripartite-type tricarboxylate transporter receptor subunit TctC
MKKLLTILLLTLSLTAHSRENVTIAYSWAASDPAANFDRAIINEANRIQDRFTFIFEAKPGAGGTVAANFALTNANTVLATSSAFFIRPNFYPNDSHDVGAFREIMPKCVVPALITSVKYNRWQDVPHDRYLTIGVSGLGTTTHLIAEQLRLKYPDIQVIPFKSTSESLVNMLAGQIDLSVNFIGDVESWARENHTKKTVNLLGVTGTQTFENVPTLISQGFSPNLAFMSPPHQYLVSARIDQGRFQELRSILAKAADTPRVRAAYYIDRCQPITIKDTQLDQYYQDQIIKWKKFSAGVKIN